VSQSRPAWSGNSRASVPPDAPLSQAGGLTRRKSVSPTQLNAGFGALTANIASDSRFLSRCSKPVRSLPTTLVSFG